MEYHERLRNFIKSQGETQAIAAKKMGYSPSSLSMYLNGREINIEFVDKLINAYPHIDLNQIFKGVKVNEFVNEPELVYTSSVVKIVEDLEANIQLLKDKLSQK